MVEFLYLHDVVASYVEDGTIGWRFITPLKKKAYGGESMPETTENVAEQFAISREDQDAFALRSLQKVDAAHQAGRIKAEITPIEIPRRTSCTNNTSVMSYAPCAWACGWARGRASLLLLKSHNGGCMAFLNINGRTVAYRLLGADSNPLVMLAHPLGMSQAVWDDLLPALLPRYRVLTWDLPGHGASQAWGERPITPADLASEALVLADHAGASRFHFVGTSIGGVVGQQLIHSHPERLNSALLTNTGAVIGTAELWTTRAGRVREEGLTVMSGEIVPRWFCAARLTREPALEAGWRTQMARTDAESYAQLCEMLGRTDFSGKLAGKGVRITLLGGSEDMATPPATLEALAAECDGAPLEILDGVGHVPSVEVPGLFTEQLLTLPLE